MIQKYAQFWLFRKGSRNSLPTIFCVTLFKNNVSHVIFQRRSEDTSSVAFEVLIIKSEIDFINLFIFNCLMSNVNLFIFNCLTSNTNLFNFNCLTSNFCFPKNIFSTSRRERMFMDARPSFRVLKSTGKVMTCYLRDTNKFLRSRTCAWIN